VRGLRKKMAKGAAWMVLLKLSERIIGLASTLILARLLIPADFGLVAMGMSIYAAVELMSSFSLEIALIQNQNAERRHYDTAWTFNVMFGVMNSVLLVALAKPAGGFFVEPRVESIMYCLALSTFIAGFSNIGIVAFQKDLELHKEFIYGIAKKLSALVVTLILAFLWRSYWALLAGMLTTRVVGVMLSYWLHPYRPRPCLTARHDLFHFSIWMLLSNLLISLVHRVPDFVIGRVVGPAALGLYTLAYEISNLPTTELVWPISRAVFPGYSKMAEKDGELCRGFVDVLSVILLVTVPAGLGIIVLSEPFVHVLLGERWLEAIPLIQVLAVFGILRACMSNLGAVYLALGRPQILSYLALLHLAVLSAAMFWLVPEHGAYGAALATLLAVAIQIPIGFTVVMRETGLGIGALAAVIWRPMVAGLAMAATIVTMRSSWTAADAGYFPGYLLQLVALVPLGAGIYVTVILGLWFINGCPGGGESKLLTLARLAFDKFFRRSSKLV
jgi:lipopolysaccharide exporter